MPGPDEYLLGEEKALLEVIEGNDPLPRIFPPYQVGLFADRGSTNPTVVDNVETLANVPHVIRPGSGVVPIPGDRELARHDGVHPVAETCGVRASTSCRWASPFAP